MRRVSLEKGSRLAPDVSMSKGPTSRQAFSEKQNEVFHSFPESQRPLWHEAALGAMGGPIPGLIQQETKALRLHTPEGDIALVHFHCYKQDI